MSTPRRKTNAQLRPREYLTPHEVDRLTEAAKKMTRNGLRNELLLLLAYRHGLRAQEALHLRWTQIDFETGVIHVNRLKNGRKSVQPLQAKTLRGLRKLKRQSPSSPFLFLGETTGTPMSVDAFQKIMKQCGEKAGFEFPVHPHMLRHACGFKLANAGHDIRAIQQYLGHNNIQHTVRYTELVSDRFKDFWQD